VGVIINKLKKELLKSFLSLAILLISLLLIHELGHGIAQLFLGVPISIGFSWFIITTTAGINLLDYPFIAAFLVLISGFVISLIPMPHLRKIIFIPKKAKQKINYKKFTFYVYLGFCVTLSLWDFFVIFLLFLR
jgi:hypothetical protein